MTSNSYNEMPSVRKPNTSIDFPKDDDKSANCNNCGSPLTGIYCAHCGQSSRDKIKYIGEIFREVLDDVVGYDSRLKHTFFPLLAKPGEITLDYIRGRRSHYVLPLRLYLITSVLLIVFLKFTAEPNFDFGQDAQSQPATEKVNGELNERINDSTDPQPLLRSDNAENSVHEIKEPKNFKSTTISGLDSRANNLTNGMAQANDTLPVADDDGDINFNLDEIEDGVFKEIGEEFHRKWRIWRNDPKPLIKQIIELLPYMMFVLLPVFALFLKLFYVFSKRYYIEHLILLLHNHSFLYLTLVLAMGFDLMFTQLNDSTRWAGQTLASIADWTGTLLFWWMVIYIALSVRRVYRQSWSITLLKTSMLMIVYAALITFGFVTTILLGVYLA